MKSSNPDPDDDDTSSQGFHHKNLSEHLMYQGVNGMKEFERKPLSHLGVMNLMNIKNQENYNSAPDPEKPKESTALLTTASLADRIEKVRLPHLYTSSENLTQKGEFCQHLYPMKN
jgi:hypothetical protein